MLRLCTASSLITALFALAGASSSCWDAKRPSLAVDGCSAGAALLQTRGTLGKLSARGSVFILGGAGQSCSEAGMEDVAENDCEAACQIGAVTGLKKGQGFKGFKKGYWGHTFPKCFAVVSGPWRGNCHWNLDGSAHEYTNVRNRAVCRRVGGDAGEEEATGAEDAAETDDEVKQSSEAGEEVDVESEEVSDLEEITEVDDKVEEAIEA